MSVEAVLRVSMFLALFAQIGFGVWLFSSRLPLRRHGRLWSLLVCAAYIGVLYLVTPRSAEPGSDSLDLQLIAFSLFLLACVGLVLARRDTTVATALFCATAGYTTQNLASGLDGLVKLLALTWYGIPEGNLALWFTSFILCTLAVYVPVYQLFVRRVRTMALDRAEHRGMVAVLVVVLLVVILFDVFNKSLPGFGVPLAVTCGLRTIHGVVCVFVLYAEYQMVFNRELELEVTATEKILEERGRQYELSRDAIAAVNRRVHDIRHQVAHRLDDAQIDRDVLSEVVRAVDVYDSNLLTGNEALDTVLAEKSLVAKREGIALTCIADGTALLHVAAADAFTLVGTMLDSAFEAVGALGDEGFRTVSLSIRSIGSMATIHVECFCPPDHEADMLVVERIVERYGGTSSSLIEEGVLSLDVVIPT